MELVVTIFDILLKLTTVYKYLGVILRNYMLERVI